MSDLAWIFPGQGAQFVGMGKALADAFPSAKAVFDAVDDALGEKLSTLMWNGPEVDLTMTANTQPALMACGAAAMAALKAEYGIDVTRGRYAAGHSLGEYTALTAVGVISAGDAARILRIRGEAMQAAVPSGQGGMAALLGASVEQAQALCDEAGAHGVIAIANDNAKGQIVLSGEAVAIDAACANAKSHGIKKAVKLAVSAPFHCPLMQPAAEIMAQALSETVFHAPQIPVITNVTVAAQADGETIKAGLVAQVTGRVRWRETMEKMEADGINATAEIGCGKVLSVMNRRTVSGVEGHVLDTPEALENFAKTLE